MFATLVYLTSQKEKEIIRIRRVKLSEIIFGIPSTPIN